MGGAIGLARKIWIAAIAAISSASLVACTMPMPTFSGGWAPAPSNVTGGPYKCEPTPNGGEECKRVFSFPGTICWPDSGATGGCGSLISGLEIEVVSDEPRGPQPWKNYFIWNYNIYNVTVGWIHLSMPYIELHLFDDRHQQQPFALILPLQRNYDNCGAVPHQNGASQLPDDYNLRYLPSMSQRPVNGTDQGGTGDPSDISCSR